MYITTFTYTAMHMQVTVPCLVPFVLQKVLLLAAVIVFYSCSLHFLIPPFLLVSVLYIVPTIVVVLSTILLISYFRFLMFLCYLLLIVVAVSPL